MNSYLAKKGFKIKVVFSLTQEITNDSVTFEDGSVANDVDVIIKCTGYTIHLPYLDKDVRDEILNEETNELKVFIYFSQ